MAKHYSSRDEVVRWTWELMRKANYQWKHLICLGWETPTMTTLANVSRKMIYGCIWNVRTLYREGVSIQLVNVLKKYKADIIALQEIRWKGQGCKKLQSCDMWFMVGERLHNLVLQFEAVNERLATIRIRAKYCNISLICAHAPTEETDDVSKESFYELLDQTYESWWARLVKQLGNSAFMMCRPIMDWDWSLLPLQEIWSLVVPNSSISVSTKQRGYLLIKTQETMLDMP